MSNGVLVFSWFEVEFNVFLENILGLVNNVHASAHYLL